MLCVQNCQKNVNAKAKMLLPEKLHKNEHLMHYSHEEVVAITVLVRKNISCPVIMGCTHLGCVYVSREWCLLNSCSGVSSKANWQLILYDRSICLKHPFGHSKFKTELLHRVKRRIVTDLKSSTYPVASFTSVLASVQVFWAPF